MRHAQCSLALGLIGVPVAGPLSQSRAWEHSKWAHGWAADIPVACMVIRAGLCKPPSACAMHKGRAKARQPWLCCQKQTHARQQIKAWEAGCTDGHAGACQAHGCMHRKEAAAGGGRAVRGAHPKTWEVTRLLASNTRTLVASSSKLCAIMAAGSKPAMHSRRKPFNACTHRQMLLGVCAGASQKGHHQRGDRAGMRCFWSAQGTKMRSPFHSPLTITWQCA